MIWGQVCVLQFNVAPEIISKLTTERRYFEWMWGDGV